MPSSPTSERWALLGAMLTLAVLPGCWEGPRVGALNEEFVPTAGGAPDTGDDAGTLADAGAPGLPFSRIVTTILVPSCADASCHGGNPPPFAPMSLEASTAWSSLVNKPASQVPTMLRVAPRDPGESYLMKKLLGTARSVGGVDSTMPLFRPPLDAEKLDAIRSWIARGAPND
ncbi:MAG: hypothetical protein JNJ54_12200 [Myxococcaceae bacterium]|nr:hypothetical protein [Myxococcaceae bacterium]